MKKKRKRPSAACYKSATHRRKLTEMRRRLGCGGYRIWSTAYLEGRFLRLILPPEGSSDPLHEWKLWYDRVTKALGSRGPGNWRSVRGIRKRKRWLSYNFIRM